jgi:NADPH:quinone reductase-like Zn-dependent oxidoreductase/predicted esterase
MAEPDYYQLIGVERNATLQEIRSKFRAKVLAEHPDKGGDPKTFQVLNKAYNVLTDQEKRRLYDSTGRSEKSAEEEFVEGFGGGRNVGRPKEADDKAVVNMSDRMAQGGAPGSHEDGFNEWLRQRDQGEMVLSDKDFMKNALFNAADMATKIDHQGPVMHVLGSPKTDAYGQAVGGAVQPQVKPRALNKTIDHDEILVHMHAVPVDDSMVYAELSKSGVCLGMSGVGRIQQCGSRIENFKQDDAVLIMPKPTKFSSGRPIGTARTLLTCNEDDLLKISPEILEELTPEQICLTPTIVCAYILLEHYGKNLKPGDSVLLNAAHLSACGSSLLQLCKLLKLKPLCLLPIQGAPKNIVNGEYGSKSAWQDADSRAVAPPNIRQQYDRVSEWLVNMGAEEVFPDSVALLRWRDRNQRMLPKLALDGVATESSCEQLIHCLQSGMKDGTIVVYGHGKSQPVEISPPLLSAWGGRLIGFNIARWVHSLSVNSQKMMAIMENITKLIRANKFQLDTVLYKVGEDAISDAFVRASDASDSAQVVLIFPSLQEELKQAADSEILRPGQSPNANAKKQKEEEDERAKLKADWLNLLFTSQSVAAMTPEGPLPVSFEAGNKSDPKSLVVWIGDQPRVEAPVLKDVVPDIGSSSMMAVAWSQHPAGEGLIEFNINGPQVLDGSWYLRDRSNFENHDLDLLHDVELLGRSLVEAIEPKLGEYGLDWKNVIILGFGKGAGVALYASILQLLPKQIAAMVLFSPIVAFPAFLAEKVQTLGSSPGAPMKLFTIWGNRNRSTPGAYRQQLAQALRKAPQVHCTPDTLPDGDHAFDSRCQNALRSLLPLCLPR